MRGPLDKPRASFSGQKRDCRGSRFKDHCAVGVCTLRADAAPGSSPAETGGRLPASRCGREGPPPRAKRLIDWRRRRQLRRRRWRTGLSAEHHQRSVNHTDEPAGWARGGDQGRRPAPRGPGAAAAPSTAASPEWGAASTERRGFSAQRRGRPAIDSAARHTTTVEQPDRHRRGATPPPPRVTGTPRPGTAATAAQPQRQRRRHPLHRGRVPVADGQAPPPQPAAPPRWGERPPGRA